MATLETIEAVNEVLGYFGILGIFGTLFLIIDMRGERKLAPYVRAWGLHVAFFITLSGTVLALVYSEIFGLIPCGLCWLSRVALFPQVLLTGVAIYMRDTTLMPLYGIWLSAFGAGVSLYQHYLQMGGSSFLPCPASGGDCLKRFFFEFGFLTFPLMSVILSAFLIALYVYIRREQKVS